MLWMDGNSFFREFHPCYSCYSWYASSSKWKEDGACLGYQVFNYTFQSWIFFLFLITWGSRFGRIPARNHGKGRRIPHLLPSDGSTPSAVAAEFGWWKPAGGCWWREVEVSPTLRCVVIHDSYSLASNSCCPAVVAEDAAFDEAPKLRPQTERSRFVCFEMSFVKWIFLREGMLGFKQKNTTYLLCRNLKIYSNSFSAKGKSQGT